PAPATDSAPRPPAAFRKLRRSRLIVAITPSFSSFGSPAAMRPAPPSCAAREPSPSPRCRECCREGFPEHGHNVTISLKAQVEGLGTPPTNKGYCVTISL